MANVVDRVDRIVWRRERRGGGRVLGGAVMVFDAGGSSFLGVGELLRSRLVGERLSFGDKLRFRLFCASVSDSSCLVVVGSSFDVDSPNSSSFDGGSCLTVAFSSCNDGGSGSGKGIVGVGKLW